MPAKFDLTFVHLLKCVINLGQVLRCLNPALRGGYGSRTEWSKLYSVEFFASCIFWQERYIVTQAIASSWGAGTMHEQRAWEKLRASPKITSIFCLITLMNNCIACLHLIFVFIDDTVQLTLRPLFLKLLEVVRHQHCPFYGIAEKKYVCNASVHVYNNFKQWALGSIVMWTLNSTTGSLSKTWFLIPLTT